MASSTSTLGAGSARSGKTSPGSSSSSSFRPLQTPSPLEQVAAELAAADAISLPPPSDETRLKKSIALWKGYAKTANLDTRLWTPRREVWEKRTDDDESEEDPHVPQMLAALQIFCWMFGNAVLRAWVHLAAEMQGGKSGVINALIRLVIQNYDTLGINPQRIFVLTGMSDDAWREQTRKRLPTTVRPNVHHNGGLKKVQAQLHKLAGADGLRNILIVLDESQVASAASNRVNVLVYTTLRELVPTSEWVARNIRILTVSATDPAKVLAMEGCDIPCRAVRLHTTAAYQSVGSLWKEKRIRALEDFGDIGTSAKSMTELARTVHAYEKPLWHILRPRQGKTADVEAKLLERFPHSQVVTWDSTSPKTGAGDDASSEGTKDLADINVLLRKAPETHSFILLKNMFYASKTLDDTNVGLLWDRMGGVVGGDNARLQSLLGRACGYGKSKWTVVYTSRDTVERYINVWRELCYNVEASRDADGYKATALHRRMPGVSAVETAAGARVVITKNTSNPVATADKDVPKKEKKDVEWSSETFESVVAAKTWASEHLFQGASAMYPCNDAGGKEGDLTHFKYRGGLRRIMELDITVASGDLDWGQGGKADAKTGSPRILPVTVAGKTRYLVVYKKFYKKA